MTKLNETPLSLTLSVAQFATLRGAAQTSLKRERTKAAQSAKRSLPGRDLNLLRIEHLEGAIEMLNVALSEFGL